MRRFVVSIRTFGVVNGGRLFSTTPVALKTTLFTDSVLSRETLLKNGITPNQKLTVQVTHVPFTALPEMVVEPFKRFGKIEYVHVPYNDKKGTIKGIAFVKFEDPLAAKRAAVQLNGFVIDDFPIRTRLASDKSHLEVVPYEILMLKNLAYDTQDEDVMRVFRAYQALRVGLRRAPVGDRPCLGYGFVRFGTVSAATRALETLQGLSIRGRQIRLKYAKPMDHNYSFIV